MNLADLQKYIGPLATVATSLGAIFGVFLWWHKRVVTRLEAEKEKAVAEKLEAIQAKSTAELKTDQARTARDAAVEKKDEILRKATELRSRYDTAIKERDNATAQVEQLMAKLAVASGVYQQKIHEYEDRWEKFAAAKKHEIEVLLGEKATAMLGTQQAIQKLEEVRAKLADERSTIQETLKHQGKVWLASVPKDVPPFRPLKERKAVIIAVLNLKGGVGKTTITANLAGCLDDSDKRVLMIDLDYQRSLSRMLLPRPELESLPLQRSFSS